jgi:hypothetical protein
MQILVCLLPELPVEPFGVAAKLGYSDKVPYSNDPIINLRFNAQLNFD